MRGQKIILGIMVVIVLLPTFFNIAGINVYVIDENRSRKEMPTVSDIKEDGFASINDWYNDVFGLRDLLIRIQHQIDYSVFGYCKTLFMAETAKGEEYLFYQNVVANEQIANEKMTETRQEEIVNEFMNVKDIVEGQGVVFKFIIAPQKNEILVEVKDKFPVNRPEENMYYIMQNRFVNSSLADNYVNIIDILKEKNKQCPVFYYTDYHWNDWGCACAFGEVVNEYARELGMNVVYNVDELKISTVTPGNNAQLANLSVLYYDIPEEYTADYKTPIDSVPLELEEHPNWVVWENTKSPTFDKALLIIGDSYSFPITRTTNGTNVGIADLFPRVYSVSFNKWTDMENGMINNLPEDVGLVIVESIESGYSWMNSYVKLLYQGS